MDELHLMLLLWSLHMRWWLGHLRLRRGGCLNRSIRGQKVDGNRGRHFWAGLQVKNKLNSPNDSFIAVCAVEM